MVKKQRAQKSDKQECLILPCPSLIVPSGYLGI